MNEEVEFLFSDNGTGYSIDRKQFLRHISYLCTQIWKAPIFLERRIQIQYESYKRQSSKHSLHTNQ